MQKIAIHSPEGWDHPELRCPVCGTLLHALLDPIAQPACDHVVFSFYHTLRRFDYLRPDLAARLTRCREESRDEDREKSSLDLVREWLGAEPLCAEFQLTSSGSFDDSDGYANSIAVAWRIMS